MPVQAALHPRATTLRNGHCSQYWKAAWQDTRSILSSVMVKIRGFSTSEQTVCLVLACRKHQHESDKPCQTDPKVRFLKPSLQQDAGLQLGGILLL